MVVPRIIFSALRGGSGKTIITTGVIAAWTKSGRSVTPFKKGPDYIDAGWLTLAALRPCRNLDTFMVPPNLVKSAFCRHSDPSSIAVIEGNRGLFDGMDTEGSTSTAELAKLLTCPVIMIADCTKSTRTVAAMILGCSHFDPHVDIRGVILNRVAGTRHENNVRANIERHVGIPVMGAIPNLSREDFPERHMGLVPAPEHEWAGAAVSRAAEVAEKYLDLNGLFSVAGSPILPGVSGHDACENIPPRKSGAGRRPRIGVVRDSAFQFYYPENIEALTEAGAEVVIVSLLPGAVLPDLDGLYIGGGFPETHARELSENADAREKVRAWAEAGLPIYAECGGLMYLSREIRLPSGTYPMAGVVPASISLCEKPAGHGYTMVRVTGQNPFYPVGTELRGHEFHYSKVESFEGDPASLAFSMNRGKGMIKGMDGFSANNVLATYTHIHALGTPDWAHAFVALAGGN
ncbi:MAG: cobyrinate a,c-diamide synthase [Deltaproteobacteria bacterium]|nr:cobyrinate a,c-diamide synthase [Deltaproteobacteria bacterium]